MLVKDLKPRTPVDEITLDIVSKGEVRDFANANGSGKVCNVAAKDEEGEEVSVTLWNDQCSQVEDGQKIKITSGWVSEFQGNLQVSTGKLGNLEILE